CDRYASNVLGRIVRTGSRAIDWKSRGIATVAKNGNGIAASKHCGIDGLKLRNLGGRCVVHDILDVRNEFRSRSSVRVASAGRLIYDRAIQRSVLQLVADPLYVGGETQRVNLRFQNQIEVARSGAGANQARRIGIALPLRPSNRGDGIRRGIERNDRV